jgi:hypothetical protein
VGLSKPLPPTGVAKAPSSQVPCASLTTVVVLNKPAKQLRETITVGLLKSARIIRSNYAALFSMPRTLQSPHVPLPVSKEKAEQIGPMYTLLPARHANGMVSGVIIYGADGVAAQEGMTEEGQPDPAC